MSASWLLWSPLWVAALAAFGSSLYLVALTLCAAVERQTRRPVMRSSGHPTRFAVLVPAHNEEAVIERLLSSLSDVDYPADSLDIYVIADNCDDSTELLAQAAGVKVLVRRDAQLHGKGYALRWALECLPLHEYDAVVIVDADSRVARDFLSVLDGYMTRGAQAVQAYYDVLNTSTMAASLRFIAFALLHFVRPLGKSLFGGSAGLKGNGMAFSCRLLNMTKWRAFSVTEDAEQHIHLLLHGVRVKFAPEARLWAEMPVSLGGARTQNLRWEAGRLSLARRWALPLLSLGVRRRSIAMIDTAAELLVPPLSAVVTLAGLISLAGWLLGNIALLVTGVASLTGLGMHVVIGLALAEAPFSVWRSLGIAPLYIVWKLWIYGQALLGAGSQKWVRTPRVSAK